MLHEKLELASKESAKRRSWAVFGFAAIFVVCLLILAVGALWKWSPPDQIDKTTAIVIEQTPPLAEQTPPLAKEDIPKVIIDTKDRDRFKEELKAFERDVEPRLEAANLSKWKVEKQWDITDLKMLSVGSFSEGKYADARQYLSQANKEAELVLKEREQIFQDSFSDAQVQYTNDNYNEAKLLIDKCQ